MSKPSRERLAALVLAQTALGEWAKNRPAFDRSRLDDAAVIIREISREEHSRLVELELQEERPKGLLRSLWEGMRRV